jgi:hypothetical protein
MKDPGRVFTWGRKPHPGPRPPHQRIREAAAGSYINLTDLSHPLCLLNAACHRHRFKFDENAACSPRRLEVASTICRCAMEPAGRERSKVCPILAQSPGRATTLRGRCGCGQVLKLFWPAGLIGTDETIQRGRLRREDVNLHAQARQLGQEKWPTIRHPRKASRRKGRDLSFRAR